MLYACTVFCIVYPLRRDGEKLPKELVPAGGHRGWLTFARMPAGQPVWTARLSSQKGTDVLPQLHCAGVKHVERGFMIKGLVEVRVGGRLGHMPQSWWCEPDLDPPPWSPPQVLHKSAQR